MRVVPIVLFSVSVAACATSPPPSSGYVTAKQLYEQSKTHAEYGTYGPAFTRFQNEQRIDDDSRCYEKGRGERVNLVLIVDGDGVVSEAYADTTTPKAECFKAAYLGAKMPVPPFSPLAILMQMN
jgi:hypothetical protein